MEKFNFEKWLFWNIFDRVLTSFQKRKNVARAKLRTRKTLISIFLLRIAHEGTFKLFYKELIKEIFFTFKTIKISEFFAFKSQMPSNVVYKFTCLCDKSLTYIG